jgi:hypothetical protein
MAPEPGICRAYEPDERIVKHGIGADFLLGVL